MPYTHLHLMDYRRMLNPHYYQTMAVHARRFRYQHNTPAREMTSSEVQTEAVSGTPRSNPSLPHGGEASSGLLVCDNNDQVKAAESSTTQSLSVNKVQEDRRVDNQDLEHSSITRVGPKRSFVIQTEDVRMECCSTPTGLNILHSLETLELAHTSQNMAKCSSVHEGHALQEEVLCLPTEQTEKSLQACPDVLLVGTPPCSNKIPALGESKTNMEPMSASSDMGSNLMVHKDAHVTRSKEDLNVGRSSKSVQFKVLHLPLYIEYLEELRKIESTVGSMEDTCIPSSEWLIKNGLMETALEVRKEVHMEGMAPMMEVPPLLEELVVEMEHMVEGPAVKIVPLIEVPVTEVVSMTDIDPTVEVTVASRSPLVDITILTEDVSQKRGEMNYQDQQDTSFESLPAYLPSTSVLSDFGNMYYCSKVPQTLQEQHKAQSSHASEVPIGRSKLNLESKDLYVKSKRERCKNRGKGDWRSLSDHECCTNRNLNENTFTPCGPKGKQICARCLAKHRIRMSVSPGLDACTSKGKGVPHQPREEAPLQTCEACKSHSKQRGMGKGSSPNVPRSYHDETEGETSENSCRTASKRKGLEDPRGVSDPKRPLTSKQHSEKCPIAQYPKLREKNCACETQRHPAAWEGPRWHPHGRAFRERDEENLTMPSLQDKWKNIDPRCLAHRWQTGKIDCFLVFYSMNILSGRTVHQFYLWTMCCAVLMLQI